MHEPEELPPASLDAWLDETLEAAMRTLTNAPPGPDVRALLIEVRRLRSIMGNWASIPPREASRKEMLSKVMLVAADTAERFGMPGPLPPHSDFQALMASPVPPHASDRPQDDSRISSRPTPVIPLPEPEPTARHVTPAVAVTPPVAVTPSVAVGSVPAVAPITVVRAPPLPALDARLAVLVEPRSPQAASYRTLRNELAAWGDPRIVAVTSARPREGRSTCAANLALALAESAGSSVLLVDASVDAPALAALFGLAPEHCLRRQLAARAVRADQEWSVTEPMGVHLHVLALDPATDRGAALDPRAFAAAVIALKERAGYDYVVLDLPSVLEGTGCKALARTADGIVVAARAGKTTASALRGALAELATMPVVGFALLEA